MPSELIYKCFIRVQSSFCSLRGWITESRIQYEWVPLPYFFTFCPIKCQYQFTHSEEGSKFDIVLYDRITSASKKMAPLQEET